MKFLKTYESFDPEIVPEIDPELQDIEDVGEISQRAPELQGEEGTEFVLEEPTQERYRIRESVSPSIARGPMQKRASREEMLKKIRAKASAARRRKLLQYKPQD
jgi:hypothetical protein